MTWYTLLFGSVTALLLWQSCAMCPDNVQLIIGSRTSSDSPNQQPTGEGITFVAVKKSTLVTEAKLPVPLIGENPSYIAYSKPRFYMVNLGSPGFVRELGFCPALPHIATKSIPATEGGGAHISVLSARSIKHGFKLRRKLKKIRDITLKRIIVTADYVGSSVSTYVRTRKTFARADVFNVPLELAAKTRNESLSNQQKVPHPHMALPYKKGVLIPDLGSDIVFYFGVSSNGRLSELSRLSLMPGDGPRHGVLHPYSDTVYIVNEISLSVVVLRPLGTGERLRVTDRMNLLRDNANKERVKAAAIRVSVDGKFLYISVRFPETIFGKIVAFSLDSSTGDITGKIGEWSSQGVHPRDFYIIEQVQYEGKCSSFLAIVNRDTDNIALVNRDMETGRLKDQAAANMSVLSPTSVLEYS